MAKSANQKLKLMYLMEILKERTDEKHYLSMSEIIEALAAYGVSAERKSIYDDFETLRTYGFNVEGEKINGKYGYHLLEHQFELAELKLLVDAGIIPLMPYKRPMTKDGFFKKHEYFLLFSSRIFRRFD